MGIRDIVDGIRAGHKAGKAALLYQKLFGIRPDQGTCFYLQESASAMYNLDEFQILFNMLFDQLLHEIEYQDESIPIIEIPSIVKLYIALEELAHTGRIHPEKRQELKVLSNRFDF